MAILTIQTSPVSELLARDYCSNEDVELLAEGLNIDFTTVFGSTYDLSDMRQFKALYLEDETGRMFFQVRHTEVHDGGRFYVLPNHLPLLTLEACYYEDNTTNSLLTTTFTDSSRLRRQRGIFPVGLQNITIQYVAGYDDTPDAIRWANAALVVLAAVDSDPDYVALMTSGRGERLTVGPVTMVEGGGFDQLRAAKLASLGDQVARAVARYGGQLFKMRTTTRRNRYLSFDEYVQRTKLKGSDLR